MQTAEALEPQYSPHPTLTPIQHRVINLLAQGSTIAAAAASLGLHRNTIGNWRRTVPAFARELEFAACEQALFFHEQIADLVPKAIEIIGTILHNEAASPSIRLRTALAIVKMATDPKRLPPIHTAVVPEREAAPAEVLSFPSQAFQSETMHISAQSCTSEPTPIAPTPIRKAPEPGRNSPCPCGSGVKFKRCCANLAKLPPKCD